MGIMNELNKTIDNHILPFLWLHGESEEVMREEVACINNCGIGAFCVEARPHPDFVGTKWWHDLDILMDEAKKRNMKVWILDDCRFPTGYANGLVKEKYPAYLKWYMDERHLDTVGPMKGASFYTDHIIDKDETLIAVVAVSLSDKSRTEVITANMKENTLYWDIPEGIWRIFFIIKTRNAGEEETKDYLNPIMPEGAQVLIEAVYEPHYRHYSDEFGNTFAGFFSDEPRFGNTASYNAVLGREKMPLPWRDDLLDILSGAAGTDFKALLPYLWQEGGHNANFARYTYMDVVSKLYTESFVYVLGNWCREHKVEYIGHVIEDEGAHSALGYGAGHFFRALGGQDMSGIDVVLKQVMPGHDYNNYSSSHFSYKRNGTFYHYVLAKLGSSLGHLKPSMKGRTICEIFGAYGWNEGLKLMKWLTDFMLVRGVNYFVPHAFSPKDFPDDDCPPHIYANGHNPQYRYFPILMKYTNHVSNLLSGGVHKASIGLLYHAEAEWYSPCMTLDEPARMLTQAQMDFDIVWAEILYEYGEIGEGCLKINDETFRCLIITSSKALPYKLLEWIKEAAMKGLEVLFIDNVPECACDVTCCTDVIKWINENCSSIELGRLVGAIREMDIQDIRTVTTEPWLRYYHYTKDVYDYYMFFNEHPCNEINTTIQFNKSGIPICYNAMEHYLMNIQYEVKRGCPVINLKLMPYESVIIILGITEFKDISESRIMQGKSSITMQVKWKVSISRAEDYPQFTEYCVMDKLENLNIYGRLPNFSGTVRYEAEFEWKDNHDIILELGEVYEIAEVWINGQNAGVKICPPYQYDISHLLEKGRNTIVIEVTNTLANQCRDYFSTISAIEPTGLIGPVKLMMTHVNDLQPRADAQEP